MNFPEGALCNVTSPSKLETKGQGLPPLAILEDPLQFVSVTWPDIRLYDKQAEVLLSLRDNYETTVHAANEVGKDFTAAIAVIWFFVSRSPARVITSSSGETQLKSILWSEIRERVNTAKFDFGLSLSSLKIERERNGKPDDLSYVIGHVTKTVENFQGHHLPHDKPRVLAVNDECSGIADEFHEAEESWAHRILNIGNPMNTRNYFYRTCKRGNIEDPAGRGGLLSNIIHISGDDSPNVQVGKLLQSQGVQGPYPNVVPGVLAYDEYIRREHKWDKIKRQIRLHGKFYEGEESLWFPPEWLDNSEAAYRALMPGGYDSDRLRDVPNHSTNLAMGVDCGAGRDLSVWTIIDRLGVFYQFAVPTPDTSFITKKTLELIIRFNIPLARVCFDAGGGGKQVVDHLRDKGYKAIRSIAFGSSPTPPPQTPAKGKGDRIEAKEHSWVYKNKRAEMHGILRQWMDPSINDIVFAIPEEMHLTREDLSVLPMWFDSDGKMFLPPKDKKPGVRDNPDLITIKKLLGRSPDRGDSLVLAVYAHASKTKRIIGARR